MSLLTSASLILTPNGYKSQKLYSIIPSTGDGDLACARATTATRVNPNGLIESVGMNVPRLDYSDGTGSWLLEPQRTNLLNHSEQFDDSYWNKSYTTITANSVISPDGTQNADIITNTPNSASYIETNIVLSATSTYTLSLYVKPLSTNKYIFFEYDYGSSGVATFNLSNQTTDGIGTKQITPVGNGWFRISNTVTNVTRFSSMYIGGYGTTPNNTSFAIWGAQLEEGSYATSYIPTTTSMVTRNVDVVSKTGISELIGQTEGTLYTEVAPMSTNLGSVTPILYIRSTDGTNRLMLYLDRFTDTTVRYILQIIKNGSQVYESDLISITNTNFTKLALRYKVGEISLWKDGIKTFTYTDPTYTAFPFTPQFENFLTVGEYGSSAIGTKLKGLQFYKTALSDAECASLTTL